jgi:hypothetical protein
LGQVSTWAVHLRGPQRGVIDSVATVTRPARARGLAWI